MTEKIDGICYILSALSEKPIEVVQNVVYDAAREYGASFSVLDDTLEVPTNSWEHLWEVMKARLVGNGRAA
ncbi:MAG: hypothetical protein QXI12_12445 [Candidatus Methanomethyliaceae archaeon]